MASAEHNRKTLEKSMRQMASDIERTLFRMVETQIELRPVHVMLRSSSLELFTEALSLEVGARYGTTSTSLDLIVKMYGVILEENILKIIPTKNCNYFTALDFAEPAYVYVENYVDDRVVAEDAETSDIAADSPTNYIKYAKLND